MKVVKFGGSSCASADQIKKVCDIILSDPLRKVAVVSAPGKRSPSDIKVTDLLIACADAFFERGDAELEMELVVKRYGDIIKELQMDLDLISDIRKDLKKRIFSGIDNREKFTDLLKAAGEDNCAKLVSKYLKQLGHNANYINPKDAGLLLSDEYANARVLPISYENLAKLKHNEGIIIFPGFFGYSPSGDVVTFPRGGSDITGSILGAALDAEMYENFTDVDSVYVANPQMVEQPKPIEEITYREMRELSYAGFSVLHEETLEPVYRKGIPVAIKNTNNPTFKGTLITARRSFKDGPVAGIACQGGFASIYLSKYMMNREIGFGRKVLHILEEEAIPFEHMPSGIDNLSIIIKEDYLEKSKEQRILKRLKEEMKVDEVNIERNLALIMVVGEGMMQTIGIASRATNALAKSDVNIEMINQGSSEVSMMFGVRERDATKATRTLYNEYFPSTQNA
jgi:aspartate kinase